MGSEGHQDIDLAILTALLKGNGVSLHSESLSVPVGELCVSAVLKPAFTGDINHTKMVNLYHDMEVYFLL